MDGLKRLGWTVGLAGVWALLAVMAVYQWDVFSMGSTEWKAVVVAIIAGVGSALTNFFMPFIKQYGIGSSVTTKAN